MVRTKHKRTFITKRSDHQIISRTLVVTDSVKELEKSLEHNQTIAIDTEFSDLHPLYANLLLVGIFDGENSWVIDATSVDIKFLNNFASNLFIAHNAKIDYQILRANGVTLPNWYDTMIVEQRLGGGHTRSNSLEATYERRLKRYMPEDKAIRKEFIGAKTSMQFKDKHITYTIEDVEGLIEIKEVQKLLIEYWKMEFLLNDIEFPLITILGNAELEGFNIDEDKFKAIITSNKSKLLKIEKELDKLRLGLPLPPEKRTGKHQRERNRVEVHQFDLFGETIVRENNNKGNFNYGSPKQVIELFKSLKLPVPWITDPKDKQLQNDSIKEEALQRYIIDFPDTIMKDFILKLLDYKEVKKELDSFGEKFISYQVITKSGKKQRGYKHPKTNRVHTTFKQCFTGTGRLSSGDSENGFYNSQQIPKRTEKINEEDVAVFRTCFVAENSNYITTADLSGAELIIMCALANDMKMYEMGRKDLHSPLATMSWRAIFLYRAGKELKIWKNPDEYEKLKNKPQAIQLIKEKRGDLYDLYQNFQVTKKKKVVFESSKVDVRTDFKSMGFGAVYGMFDKKGGETLNIPKDEAKVVLTVIREELIETFKMVEAAADQAMRDGFVVHNTRTNSLRRFPLTDKGKDNMTFMEEVDTRSEARNTRIQGTQADMIKESMVEIQKIIDRTNEPAWLRLNVHDELVYEHTNFEFGKVVADTMVEVANRYLIPGIEMGVEFDTLRSWTK